MVRRHRTSGELAFYHCSTPRPTPLAVLVRVAGGRRRVEERIKTGKGLAGLDRHQARARTPPLPPTGSLGSVTNHELRLDY